MSNLDEIKNLKKIFSQINGHIFRCAIDHDGTYVVTFSDGRMAHKYQVETARFKGLPLKKMMGEQLYKEVKYYYDMAFKGELVTYKSFQFEDCYCTTVLTAFEFNESGNVIEIMGESRDISDLYCSEQEYLENKNILNHIIEFSPYSIQILDPEGHHLSENKAFWDLFCVTPPSDWSILDDPVMSPEYGNLIAQVLEGNVVTTPPVWYNARTVSETFPDKPVCIGSVIFPVILNTTLEYIIIMHNDITDHVHKKEQVEEFKRSAKVVLEEMGDVVKKMNRSDCELTLRDDLGHKFERLVDHICSMMDQCRFHS